jgi:hypothetical protein
MVSLLVIILDKSAHIDTRHRTCPWFVFSTIRVTIFRLRLVKNTKLTERAPDLPDLVNRVNERDTIS